MAGVADLAIGDVVCEIRSGQICSALAHDYVLLAAWLRKRLMRLVGASMLSLEARVQMSGP